MYAVFVVNPSFLVLVALALLALVLIVYWEVVGLGLVGGMNDMFG